MDKLEFVKCDFDDDECCEICRQKNTSNFYKVVPGTQRCPRHGGAQQLKSNKQASANAYRIQVWNGRIREMTGYDQVKVLREEIALMRVMLEEQYNLATTPQELMMFSVRIESIITSISKLVIQCERLEKNMGEMMDKPSQFKMVSQLVEIVSRHVDPDILDTISEEVLELLQ